MIRDLIFNLLILLVDGLVLAWVCRSRRVGTWSIAALTAAAAMLLLGRALSLDLFHALRLYCFATFLHAPLLLTGAAFILRGRSAPAAAACGACVLALAAVGVDAFLIEPGALEVNPIRIETSRIDRPVRIAVVADLQTDRVGAYERRALSAVLSARPDMILMPGDYVQATRSRRPQLVEALRELMDELEFQAPLGVFAVRGNVDRRGWMSMFDGLPVEVIARRTTHRSGGISVTGLGLSDSFDSTLRIPRAPGFHVVFGHAPDFALGDIRADLLVAGHTHGGQVRLPLFGPPITFSRVPRSWASGVTRLASGATLLVSRGIGMERGHAPRMRFLCRPEVVVIDVVPRPEP